MCLQEMGEKIVEKILANSRLNKAFRAKLWGWFMCNLTSCRAVGCWSTLSGDGTTYKI